MTQKKIVVNPAMAWLSANNVVAGAPKSGGTKGPNKQELLRTFILKTFEKDSRPPSRDECMTHLYGTDKNSWKPKAFKNYCSYLRGGDNYAKKKYRIDLVENNGIIYIVGWPNADFTELLTFDEVSKLK